MPNLPPRLCVVAWLVTALLIVGCSDGDTPSEGATSGCGTVACDSSADTPCSHNVCDPTIGACAVRPRNEGLACDDGDPCTLGDVCAAGVCAVGKTDLCGCREDADCKGDGDPCTGVTSCDTQAFPYRCVTSAAVVCAETGKPCRVNACDPKSGACVEADAPDGAACDDGDACSAGDACAAGACKGKTDICVCTKDSDCPDDDGNPCTGSFYCDTSDGGPGACKLNPATVVTCSDKSDTACRKNTCLPATGACELVPVKDDTPCDDGDSCTANDACVAGSCVGGLDTCKCTADADCAKLEDGNQCNGLLYCDKASGACVVNPSTIVQCPTVDDTACAKNVCLPKTGACAVLPRASVKLAGCVDVDLGGLIGKQCLWLPADTTATGSFPCDDDNACTVGEICQGASCGGGKVTCECDEDSDCLPKDDGDLCNGTLFCDKSTGSCKPNPASVVYCSKAQDTDCEKAQCDPKSGGCGLKPVASAAACDDGEPCTVKDACDGEGACVGGGPNGCDDGDSCTIDSCAKGAGCKHAAKGCDDGNSCTEDACVAKTGQCSNQPRPKGFVCDADQDGCTVGDFCDGTSCKAGKAFSCPAPVDPCLQSVCVSKGAVDAACATVARPDGTSCPDDPKACLLGAQCKAGVCAAGDKPRLFSRSFGEVGVVGRYLAVSGAPGGGFVAVGYEEVGKSARWLITRVERDGSVRWEARIAPASGQSDAYTRASAVALPGDGSVWVGGRWTNAKGQPTSQVRRFDDVSGKQIASVVMTTNAWRVIAMAPLSAGGVLVTRSFGTAGGKTECVRHHRLSATLATVWTSKDYCGWLNGQSTANSLAVSGQIAAFTAQSNTSPAPAWGYQVIRLTDGDLQTRTSTTIGTYDQAIGAGAISGGRVAILHAAKNGAPGAQLRTLRADGGRGFDEPRMMALAAPIGPVSRGSSGALGLAGSSSKGGYLASLNRVGSVQWRRDFVEASPHALRAVAAVGDDLVSVGWRHDSNGTARPWVVRGGPFGHTTCGALGACAGRSWADCDDAKDCTADACDSSAGCTHAGQTDTSCTAEDSCSAQGVCLLGVCKPGRIGRLYNLRQGFSTAGGKSILASSTSAAVEVADGAVLLAGFTKPSGGTQAAFRIPIDAEGAEVLPESVALCSGMSAGVGLRALDAGALLAYGAGGGVARLCRIPATGSAPSSVAVTTCTTCKGQAMDADARTDGSMVAIAQQGSGDPVRGARVSAQGKLAWSVPIAALDLGRGVAARPQGGAVFVGAQGAGPSQRGALVASDHLGKIAWVVQLDPQSSLEAAALTKSGAVVAVGTRTYNAVSRSSVVVRLDEGTGKVAWTRITKPADLSAARGVVATLDDGIAFAGDVIVDKVPRIFLERLDAAGKQVWRRSYRFRALWPTLYPAVFGGLSQWSGGFLLAGHLDGAYPGVIRTDASGHDTCDGSGACVDHKPATCDDKNPCTTDWCDAKGGCQHTAVTGCDVCTSDAACKSSDPCVTRSCQAGQCVPKPVVSTACCPKAQLSEDFDTGTAAKLVNSKGGAKGWQVVAKAAKASSGTSALQYGDPKAGDYVFGGGGHSGTATWPVVTLPSGSPQLRLKLYLDVESSTSYDKFEVRLLRAGKSAVVLWSKGTGTTKKWLDLTLPLGAWAAEAVQLQLWFDTVDGFSNKGSGVFVDDVRIAPPCG